MSQNPDGNPNNVTKKKNNDKTLKHEMKKKRWTLLVYLSVSSFASFPLCVSGECYFV